MAQGSTGPLPKNRSKHFKFNFQQREMGHFFKMHITTRPIRSSAPTSCGCASPI